MHPVRQTILEILKRESHATVVELAQALNMAPVSVRHHLDLLIGDDLVYTPRVRRRQGAGRPQQVYALTPAADADFPDNYCQLDLDSLQALTRGLDREQLQEVMAGMGRRMAAQAAEGLRRQQPENRMNAVVGFLKDQGYMASCETKPGVVFLHTCNCPYKIVVTQHRELCQLDMVLINELTGVEPQRTAHIADGDNRCSYRLQFPTHSTSAASGA